MAARQVPANELDMAWMTVTPDYGELSEGLEDAQEYWKFMEVFRAGFRLGDLSESKTNVAEEYLQISFECFNMGLAEAGMSFIQDVASMCEISQSKKGFRSQMLNTIKQIINKREVEAKEKGVFGNKKE